MGLPRLLYQLHLFHSLAKKIEIEDVVSVIRAREGAVRGYGPVAGVVEWGQVTLTPSEQAGFTLKRRHKL